MLRAVQGVGGEGGFDTDSTAGRSDSSVSTALSTWAVPDTEWDVMSRLSSRAAGDGPAARTPLSATMPPRPSMDSFPASTRPGPIWRMAAARTRAVWTMSDPASVASSTSMAESRPMDSSLRSMVAALSGPMESTVISVPGVGSLYRRAISSARSLIVGNRIRCVAVQ